MKKLALITTTLALCVIGSTSTASAQQGAINIEAGTRIGLGDWADISNPGIGGTIGGLYQLDAGLALTGRVGYFAGLPKEANANILGVTVAQGNIKTNELPLLVGARYYLGSDIASQGVWVGAELGATQITSVAWVENGDGDVVGDKSRDSEVKFSAMLSGGYDAGDYGGKVGLLWIPLEDSQLIGLTLTIEADVFRF